jgi:Kdo2-lipid IVA lauroyltransferase/acyltransferase
LTDYILYLIVKVKAFFLRLLPLRFSLWAGRAFGSVIYYLIGKRRQVAYVNLRAAFRGRYTPAQLDMIIKRVYQNLSQSYVELLRFPRLDEAYVKKYVKVEGADKIVNALKEDAKGAIFLTAHFGNWELSSLVGSAYGLKMNVLARWQKLERLNGYLNKMRGSKGARVIFKKDAKEEIMRALKDNEVVGILSDQDGGKRGEFVDFFGRKASIAKGVAQFSLRTGAPIFPVFIIREKGPYHRIFVGDDISVLPSGNIKKDIHEILQRFAGVLQSYIEKYPSQWLWLHKRWKSTPTKYVLVLSDGKSGHLKQSLAVAGMIKELRAESGYGTEDTTIQTLELRFKNKYLRAVFDLGTIFGFSVHRLSFCFSKEVYNRIIAAYADFIVSCGSSTAGIALSLKKDLNAKAIAVMRPNIHSVKNYDLAIMPLHDKIKKTPKIVFTKGTVTGLTAESLSMYASALRERVNVAKGNIIGVLIGGDSKAYALEAGLAAAVLGEVLRAAEELDAEVLITTSRRTSGAVVDAVKARLRGAARVKLLLIAGENNFEGAIEGILALSNILIVSGESVAMITEAIASGRRPLVFMPRKKQLFFRTKQESAIMNLEKEGLVRFSDAGRIKDDIRDSGRQAPSGVEGPAAFNDRDLARSALSKII